MLQKILSYTRRAVDDYNMIGEGDRIAVGVSGGKDSLALATALGALRRFYPRKFTIEAITLDLGYENMNFDRIASYMKDIDVPYTVVKTDIREIVFDIRKEANPCSLCAKLRRGALHEQALKLGCKKVALGHHYEDVTETMLLSLFYEGRVSCFSPVTYLDRKEITLIRPLIYTPEKLIKAYALKNALPIEENKCPADGNTKRQEVKDIINSLNKTVPCLRDRVFTAVKNSAIPGWNTDEGIKSITDK